MFTTAHFLSSSEVLGVRIPAWNDRALSLTLTTIVLIALMIPTERIQRLTALVSSPRTGGEVVFGIAVPHLQHRVLPPCTTRRRYVTPQCDEGLRIV